MEKILKDANYKNVVVKKPWGYEYLTYENEYVGLWFLHIEKDQETSLHCHPKKDTGLIVLDGAVNVSFLNDITRLVAGRKVMIRKGLFHSTKAISEEGANIFEIETPKIKHDIVRLEDKYGREGKPYEGKSFEKEKDNECIFFSDPLENQKNTYIFKNSKITLQSITKRDAFLQIEDDANIIFLNGGIQSNEEDILVASPGHVIASHIVKRLLVTFKNIHPKTVIMLIEPLA